MAKRRGATARDPKYTTQPVKGGVEQVARETNDVKGDMTAARRAASRMPTERLSPGVYRSAGGGLVTQKGRPLQRQPQAPMQPVQPQAPAQPAPSQSSPSIASGLNEGQSQRFRDMMQRGFNPMGGGSEPEQQIAVGGGMMGNSNYYGEQGQFQTGMRLPEGQMGQQMPMDKMYRWPQAPQMPQPSANMGGQYRLSPGVYGNQQQAMNQYNQEMQQMYQPMVMPQVRKG